MGYEGVPIFNIGFIEQNLRQPTLAIGSAGKVLKHCQRLWLSHGVGRNSGAASQNSTVHEKSQRRG
jgi:hypothetical protein